MNASKKTQFLLIFLFTVFFHPAVAQSLIKPVQENKVKADSSARVIKAIPLNSINNVSTESFTLFNKVGTDLLKNSDKENLSWRIDSIVSRTNAFFNDTSGISVENLNFRELEILGNSLLILLNDITTLQAKLYQHLQALQKDENSLIENNAQWSLTLKANDQNNTPEAIIRRINNVISVNDSVLQRVQNDISFLLTQSDKVTSQQIRLDQFKTELQDYNRISSSRVFKRDMPPIWKSIASEDSVSLSDQYTLFRSNIHDDTSVLTREYTDRLILALCFFILLILLVFWLRATIKEPNIQSKKVIISLYVNQIFRKPVEVILLIGLYFIWIIIPEIPTSYSSFLAMFSVYAILRLAFDILPHGYRRFLIGFAIAYVLLRFYNLFYDQSVFSRLMLMVAQSIAITFLIGFVNSRRLAYSRKKTTFNYILSVISVLYLVFLVVAFLGNIFGTLSFSEFLSSGIIRSGFLILTTYVGFHISAGLLYLLLISPLFKSSNIIRKQSEFIFKKLIDVVRLFFVLSWFYIALDHFKVREAISEWGNAILTSPISIGQASFSLMNIILFVFVIWLSIWISRIVRHILNEEVFPRVRIERGMPGTIIMLVRISLVTIGFLLAAAAAGMKLSNLTIIIGAFSVGIGFGLQNIFNNLVSGLILAFERPIKEGDIVEVNTLLGTVKKIGIRSSIVRTFSGAEVIVPNGELISNDLINWTLSDQYRRADIRLGVAYGTDPEIVTNLLIKVAEENKRVIQSPPPQAFFVEFGDSSLNFRLLAWMDQDHRFEVESEIMIEINRKLKEAAIEIPFPQRDLHVKSVTVDAGKKLKGK